MPLASGWTGTNAYTAEDVVLTKVYNQSADLSGANSAQYAANRGALHTVVERNTTKVGATMRIYDPELAALLGAEIG